MTMAGRQDWIQADLRCLLCGRVSGRLIGPLRPGEVPTGRSSTAGPPRFAAFRPADASVPAVRLLGGERFRCTTCGGALLIDEPETFSTYHDTGGDEQEPRPRRGRPPKPWRQASGAPDWLVQLGLAG